MGKSCVFVCGPLDKGFLSVASPTDLSEIFSPGELRMMLRQEGVATVSARRVMAEIGIELPLATGLPKRGDHVVFTDGSDFVGAVAL